MNSSDLRSIMERHGIVQDDLATISGKTTRQVRSWLSGAFPVPRMLVLVLMALDEGLIDGRWLLTKIREGGN